MFSSHRPTPGRRGFILLFTLVSFCTKAATTFTIPSSTTYSGGNVLTWLVSTTGTSDSGPPYTIVIPPDVQLTINNANFNVAADLSGNVLIQIQGTSPTGGKIYFTGSSGKITINTGDFISVNPANTGGLHSGSAHGNIKIDTDGTDYNGHDLSAIIAAGGVSGDGSLPVEWLYFNAVRSGRTDVHLQWATATERDNDYFAVEHSRNGLHFEAIGKVKGAGTSNTTHLYEFLHRPASTGIHYYRIVQVDLDGKTSSTPLKVIEIEDGEEPAFRVNRSGSLLNVQLFAESDTSGKLGLFDSYGRPIIVQAIPAGEKNLWLNVNRLPAATYVLVLNVDGRRQAKQITLF